ncbi:MAG: hypothetical protein Q6366_004700 [Candidatus Freyarchaeota archaeon]
MTSQDKATRPCLSHALSYQGNAGVSQAAVVYLGWLPNHRKATATLLKKPVE